MTVMKQTLSISAGLFALAALTHPAELGSKGV